jgi:predicted nucleic acid-binding protein
LTRQQKGLVLDENDLWIAATALALDAVLITHDSDFQQIEGLSVSQRLDVIASATKSTSGLATVSVD